MGLVRYFEAGKVTELLIRNCDTPMDTKKAWMSLCLIPGSYVVKKLPFLQQGYVVSSSEKGALIWLVDVERHGSQRHLVFKKEPGHVSTNWSYWYVSDPSGYLLNATEVLPPAASLRENADGRPKGIAIVLSDGNKLYKALEFNAQHGFRGWTCQYMKKLVHELEVAVHPVPSNEGDLVKCLTKHIYPTIDDLTLASYMGQRSHRLVAKFDSVFKYDGMGDLVADIGDGDMQEEILKDAAAYRARVGAQKLVAKIGAKAKAKPAPKKKKCAGKFFHLVEEARALLPVADGCTLHQETEWHARFKVYYPTPYPPHSHGAPYEETDDKSVEAAMKEVLYWAWCCHFEATGQPCPYDLV